jgi:pilus assembly protein CpaE
MDILIASNDQAIAAKIRGCLQELGVACPLTQIVSFESAQLLATSRLSEEPSLMLFGSRQIADEELSLLKNLCAAGSDRLKVVVVCPTFSGNAILQSVRSGAIDCLSLNHSFATELKLLLDRLETARQEPSRLAKLLTVISAAGGTGASLVASNLAAAIARREEKCGLLDLHWHGGDLAALLNAIPRHTLLSLASKSDNLDQTMLEQSFFRHECGVHLLASPEPFSDFRQIRPELVQKVVQLSRGIFPTVVVDLEDCEHFDQVRTLAASDRIVLVIRPDFVSLMRTKKLLSYLLSAQVAREHIALVANRVGQAKEIPIAQVEEALGMRVTHRVPDDPAAVNEAINLGVPLVVGCPKSKVAAEIARLGDWLLGMEASPSSVSWMKTTFIPLKTMFCFVSAVNA